MLRVSLIGPGDIKFYYFNLLKLPKAKFYKQIEEIAKVLKESEIELVLLPDKGVSFEVAKKYKELGGAQRVYATMPLSDTDFIISHLFKYLNAKVSGKKIFDEIIDTQNWYKQDLTHCTYGDFTLMLGNSLGSLGEFAYGFYLYKIFKNSARRKKVHPEIRAGEKIPFSAIVYKPFIKEKLNYEIEAYIKKVGAEIYYAKSPIELKKIIKKLKEKAALSG